MSQHQTPSPGRIVLTNVTGDVRPAVITRAHSDGSVDLHVLQPTHRCVRSGNDSGLNPKVDLSLAASWVWPPRV